jgi:hypothetical protein
MRLNHKYNIALFENRKNEMDIAIAMKLNCQLGSIVHCLIFFT